MAAFRGPHWEPLQCPLNNGEGAVQVWPDELAQVAFEDVANALVGEVPPLQVWHKFAVAFRRLGRGEQFRQILDIVRDNEQDIAQHIRDDPMQPFQEGKLLIINAATATVLEQSEQSALDTASVAQNVTEAMKVLDGADALDPNFALSNLNKGLGNLYLGHSFADDPTRAVFYYDRALARFNALVADDRVAVPALLGKAAILYNRGRFPLARDLYMKVLRLHPHATPDLRVAIGLCSFQMGEWERSRLAFRRALQLSEGTNVQALMGEALLVSRLDDVGLESRDDLRNRQHSHRLVELADHFARHKDSMALNHLANILFFRWKPIAHEIKVVDEQTLELATDAAALERRIKHGDPLRLDAHLNAVFAPDASGAPPAPSVPTLLRLRDPLPSSFLQGSAQAHVLHVRELERAYTCAAYAHNLTKNPKIRAESLFHIGRIFHARGQVTKARQNYKLSFAKYPTLPLPYLGYAQVQLDNFLQDPPNNARFLVDAYQTLLTLERHHPKFPEALMLQSAILAHLPPDAQKALKLSGVKLWERRANLLAEVTRLPNPSADAYLQLANALARLPGRGGEALRSYDKALDAGAQSGKKVHLNIAVLALAAGLLDKAQQHLKHCLATLGGGGEGYEVQERANEIIGEWHALPGLAAIADGCHLTLAEDCSVPPGGLLRVGREILTSVVSVASPTSVEVTTRLPELPPGTPVSILRPRVPLSTESQNVLFTLAHLHERRGFRRAAAELYKILMVAFPDFWEAHCRLALLSWERGDAAEAEKIIAAAAETFGDGAIDVQLMRGYLAISANSFRTAQEALKTVKAPHPYSLCASATLFHASLDDPNRRVKHLGHAASQFKHALRLDQSNIVAAHGLGLTLVAKRDFPGAAQVFQRLRLVTAAPLPEATMNLAHLKVRQGDATEGLSLYSGLQGKSCGGRSAALQTYTALGQLLSKDRVGAVKSTQRAVHLAPFNLNLWYNCAFAHEQHAEKVLLHQDAYTVSRLRRALHFLDFAVRTASFLIPAAREFPPASKRGPAGYPRADDLYLPPLAVDFQPDRLSKRKDFRMDQMTQAREILSGEVAKELTRRAEVEEKRRKEQEDEARLQEEQRERDAEQERAGLEARKKVQEETRRKNEILRERQKVWEVQEIAKAEAKKKRGVQKSIAQQKLGDDQVEAVRGKRKDTRDTAAPEEVDELDWGSSSDNGAAETKAGEERKSSKGNDSEDEDNDDSIFTGPTDEKPAPVVADDADDSGDDLFADESQANDGEADNGEAAAENGEGSDESADVAVGKKRKAGEVTGVNPMLWRPDSDSEDGGGDAEEGEAEAAAKKRRMVMEDDDDESMAS